ncbi:MAG: DUF4118 domain-containing protein [Ilumatobacteraceae bacterium]
MKTSAEPAGRVALAVGPAVALAAAGLLDGVRDDIGVVNVALILSFIVVVAALSGRPAGLTTAVIAGMSYNFFHTRPFHSLRISSGSDVLTVGMLMGIGVIVSEMSAWRRRAHTASLRRLRGARALEAAAEQLAAGSDPDVIWSGIRTTLIDMLGLADCRFEPGSTASVEPLPRSGSLFAGSMRLGRDGFEMPATGTSIAVAYAGRTIGHIVLVPSGNLGSSRDIRQVAVALADEYAVALATALPVVEHQYDNPSECCG